jgi:hypothetical protein
MSVSVVNKVLIVCTVTTSATPSVRGKYETDVVRWDTCKAFAGSRTLWWSEGSAGRGKDGAAVQGGLVMNHKRSCSRHPRTAASHMVNVI